uniref:TLC domain-containing protein n=2 Tax=Guillardia theta TaxID=55529 RepID=A0A7S4PFM1_GUITH|mmetsp:Transcript_49775/g.155765  ORF Transcript_49775/g.155765 Transcript_49775/m.155765 type:complete len:248 (+) Transcript_49775:202-945(+)
MSICFFAFNRACAGFLHFLGFKEKRNRNYLGSCMVSVVHCSLVSFITYEELSSRDWSFYGTHGARFDLSAPNTPTGTACLLFCSAFMIADQLFMLIWCPEETLFLLHHVATLLYMGSCLYLQAGDLSVALCIFLGEITNPINNFYAITDCLNNEKVGKLLEGLHYIATWSLFLALSLVRLVYSPYAVCWVLFKAYMLEAQGSPIPLIFRMLWVSLPVAVVIASYLFVKGLLADIQSGKTTTFAKSKK